MTPTTATPDTTPNATDDALRGQIVQHLLAHAPYDGFSALALRRAGADAGTDDFTLHRLFPGGIAEAVAHYQQAGDRAMTEAVTQAAATAAASPGVPPALKDRIAQAVMHRLAVYHTHPEALRALLAYYALPGRWCAFGRTMYESVDAIWYAVGDTSVDFSFYTKRASLAAIYKATLYYSLTDHTPDLAPTRGFLQRRIADLLRFGKAKRTAQGYAQRGLEGLASLNPARLCGAVRRRGF